MKEMRNIKIKVDMYDDTKFKIIDTKPERDLIHYIWTRMLALAGKVNLDGDLYLSRNIPYSNETLAIEFNRDVMQVKLALKVLMELEMITLGDNKVYKVKNFSKYQNGGHSKRTINKEEKEVNDDPEEKIENKINDLSTHENEALITSENSSDKEEPFNEVKEQLEYNKIIESNEKLETDKKDKKKKKTFKVEEKGRKGEVELTKRNNNKKRKNKSLNENDIIEAKDDTVGEFIEFYEGDARPLGKNERVIMEFKV